MFALSDFDGANNTMTSAFGGFIQIFNYSPIGDILQQGFSEDSKSFVRMPHNELSDVAFAYSHDKYASEKNIRSLRVSDF